MTYSEKLKNPSWQKKRLEIFSRDGFACQFCFDTENTLHVHHLKYKGVNPWDTPDKYLLTICEECHKKEHAEQDIVAGVLRKALTSKGFSVEHIKRIAEAFASMPPFHIQDVMTSVLSAAVGDFDILKLLEKIYFDRLGK
jgi:hypothetical protein